MRILRIYCENKLFRGEILELASDVSHHLQNVLRRESGDEIEVFNHEAKCFKAKIIKFDKKKAQIEILAELDNKSESSLNLTLGICLIKPDKMDIAIQKSVELGVSRIVPLISSRTSVNLDQKRMANKIRHWQAIATSASAQSHRVVVPEVSEAKKLHDFIGSNTDGSLIFFHPQAQDSLDSVNVDSNQATVLIGPEGGFTEDEALTLKNFNWQCYNLGNRILRAETAAIAAVTLLQFKTGNM